MGDLRWDMVLKEIVIQGIPTERGQQMRALLAELDKGRLKDKYRPDTGNEDILLQSFFFLSRI